MINAMQLSVPSLKKPDNNAFDSNATNLNKWIDNLPMANVGEATRQLYLALADMNNQRIPDAQRLQALEILTPSINYVTESLKKHFVGQGLPLTEKQHKVARLTRELTHELATGYKILVVEQQDGDKPYKDKKLFVKSIYHALRLLGSVLLKCYQTYTTYPRNVWSEIHTLYHYAETHKLHEVSILNNNESHTISDKYKQILLLALACPYRMRHGVVEKVYTALNEWALHCRLAPLEYNTEALFVTTMDSDQPPTYLVLRNSSSNPETTRILETESISEDVRQALTNLRSKASQSKYQLSANTLRRLMLAWGVMPKRRFSRTRDHAQIVAATGLCAIHYFVSGESVFNQPSHGIVVNELGPEGAAAYRSSDSDDNRGGTPEMWEMNYRLEGEARPSSTEETVAMAASGMRINRSYDTQAWKMVNVSAGGYCLLWDNQETTRAQVGELVGIREQSDPDTFHWRLGVIRWLKMVEKRGLELGIQMLSPSAIALTAKPDTTRRIKDNQSRGLLVPEITSIQQSATLLLPSPPFSIDDTVIIDCNGKEVKVKLTKLVENTGSFAQFQFVSLGAVPRPITAPVEAPKLGEFDDIWDIL
jgi:hypothetical protein